MNNTTEKLNAIKAKCIELLAIAKQRTAGKWYVDSCNVCTRTNDKNAHMHVDGGYFGSICETGDFDDCKSLDFIASCAGPAEAGWRATIAAIDETLHQLGNCSPRGEFLALAILTSWEGLV